MKLKNILIAVLLFGGLAYAATEAVDRITSSKPQHFLKGMYIGTDSDRVATDTSNKLAHTGAGLIDFVFPAMPDDGGTAGTVCQYSVPSATVEGATVGDPCMVGTAAAVVPTEVGSNLFDCVVTATNTVKVRRCAPRGAAALLDGGFYVRTFSGP